MNTDVLIGAAIAALALKSVNKKLDPALEAMKSQGISPENFNVSETQLKIADAQKQYRDFVNQNYDVNKTYNDNTAYQAPVAPSNASSGGAAAPSPTGVKIDTNALRSNQVSIGQPTGIVAQPVGFKTNSSGISGGNMAEKLYSNLGAALTAMDIDSSNGVVADIRRGRGGDWAQIQEFMPEGQEKVFSSSEIKYYPNKTVVDSVVVSPREAANQISDDYSEFIPNILPEGMNLETALRQSIYSASEFVNDAQSEFSMPAQGVLAKFNNLDDKSKLMVLGAGYFAVKTLPSKYLWLAAGLLAYSQLKK